MRFEILDADGDFVHLEQRHVEIDVRSLAMRPSFRLPAPGGPPSLAAGLRLVECAVHHAPLAGAIADHRCLMSGPQIPLNEYSARLSTFVTPLPGLRICKRAGQRLSTAREVAWRGGRPAGQPRAARRLPALHWADGLHPHSAARAGPSATHAGRRTGRQGVLLGRYKARNTVERCFNKLKNFRAVATRYDKREPIYQCTIDVASIRIWLRHPVT